ncbi:MAG: Holliday junction branch migration protein RuvA [Bacteroidaceae bacterium]|nr:Holliday junction branch migration protein RuvA [Bacteroidaceae bacterium]
MIDYIKGEIAELTPTRAVLDTAGVGYSLFISLGTYSAIQGKKQAKLYVYESIREDAHQLFGFVAREERELFLLLISVSGVGAGTARTILSAYSPQELATVISTENTTLLKSVKGIGLKTAQRILVDLKDKVALALNIPASGENGTLSGFSAENNTVQSEAVQALTMLGFQPVASQKVELAILKEEPDAPVEKVIKQALKRL